MATVGRWHLYRHWGCGGPIPQSRSLSLLTPVLLSVGYGTGIIALTRTSTGSLLLGWAAPVGRMVAQSIIFGWIFYGYGLGLFGKLGLGAALTIGVRIQIRHFGTLSYDTNHSSQFRLLSLHKG